MDNKNTKEVERKYILLIDFSISSFPRSSFHFCDIVLNLPDVDNEHAKISNNIIM